MFRGGFLKSSDFTSPQPRLISATSRSLHPSRLFSWPGSHLEPDGLPSPSPSRVVVSCQEPPAFRPEQPTPSYSCSMPPVSPPDTQASWEPLCLVIEPGQPTPGSLPATPVASSGRSSQSRPLLTWACPFPASGFMRSPLPAVRLLNVWRLDS